MEMQHVQILWDLSLVLVRVDILEMELCAMV